MPEESIRVTSLKIGCVVLKIWSHFRLTRNIGQIGDTVVLILFLMPKESKTEKD